MNARTHASKKTLLGFCGSKTQPFLVLMAGIRETCDWHRPPGGAGGGGGAAGQTRSPGCWVHALVLGCAVASDKTVMMGCGDGLG